MRMMRHVQDSGETSTWDDDGVWAVGTEVRLWESKSQESYLLVETMK